MAPSFTGAHPNSEAGGQSCGVLAADRVRNGRERAAINRTQSRRFALAGLHPTSRQRLDCACLSTALLRTAMMPRFVTAAIPISEFGLKAVFVFSGRCGRRPRCNSFLSFQSLIQIPLSPAGGDPFSHPSGSSVSRPAWVTVRTAAGGLSSARSARPPPGPPGARKHSVPNRVHSVGNDLWLARPLGSASNLSQTLGLVESP
jgi:hypothetical protein